MTETTCLDSVHRRRRRGGGTASDDRQDEDAPMPLWVYVAGIAIVVLALGFIVLHLAGGGFQH